MDRILKGLLIFSKYSKNGDFAAEHDQIWAGPDAEKMEISKEDLIKLDELGWWIDEDFDSWSHFC